MLTLVFVVVICVVCIIAGVVAAMEHQHKESLICVGVALLTGLMTFDISNAMTISRTTVEQKAIQVGAAHYVVDEKGNTSIVWNEKAPSPTVSVEKK